MIRHAIHMRFAEGTTAHARNVVLGDLIALGDHLGHVISFACGPDADPEAKAAGFTHAFVVAFETRASHDRYLALPEYADAMRRLTTIAAGGVAGLAVASRPAGGESRPERV